MERSWLIQRLQKPWEDNGTLMSKMANAFSFGGGLKNGGLSNEAMGLIKDIFRFDYMGSAEFEFGEVPKAFSKLWEGSKDYIGFEIKAKYKVQKDWKTKEETKGTKPVWILCHKDWKEEVVKRVKYHATHQYSREEYGTKEMVHLAGNLAGIEYNKDYVGWLELDNGYMFFSDKETYDKTRRLFAIGENDG